jgi:hypothetical protein
MLPHALVMVMAGGAAGARRRDVRRRLYLRSQLCFDRNQLNGDACCADADRRQLVRMTRQFRLGWISRAARLTIGFWAINFEYC